jgi:phenylacetate-CoA ligase
LRARRDLLVVRNGDEWLLRDRHGVRAPARLSPLEYSVWLSLAHGMSDVATRRAIAQAHGVRLGAAALRAFRDELAAEGLFEGRTADGDRLRAWRRDVDGGVVPVDSGRDAAELRLVCQVLLEQASAHPPPPGRVEAVLSPHGDLAATGACAARAYATLDEQSWPDAFVIVATSHYAETPTLLLQDARTPLGVVRCDRELAEALRERTGLRVDGPELLIEHAWSQDLPLLQVRASMLGRPLRFVALLAGQMPVASARALGTTLRDLSFLQLKRLCLVVSGDLTHYGEGYGWDPPWLPKPTVREVVAAVRAYEAPLLDAIARRDRKAVDEGVRDSSFCARAQLATLMAFAPDDGHLLAHQTVLNWRALDGAAPARRWRDDDKLFDGASIAFTWGGDGARRLCGECVWRIDAGKLELVHRCEAALVELPAAALPVVRELARGWDDVDELCTRAAVERDPLAALILEMDRLRLFHPWEPPSALPAQRQVARAEQVIARARTEVPYYGRLRSTRLADAPILRGTEVREAWEALAARRATGDDVVWRRSSGTALTTVVEARVERGRRDGELVLQRPLVGRALSVNRPSNLGLSRARRFPASRLEGDHLRLTPGENPSAITPETWREAIAAAVAFGPRTLEGDPAYLAGFARACLAEGVQLDVERVYLGHAYAWTLYKVDVRRAFPSAELVPRLHSSELGEMALGCEEDVYHLNETQVCWEILDARRRPVRIAGEGELVATTLDTQLRPLIRFAIGDRVQLVAARCPCGRPFRTVRYLGRREHSLSYPRLDAAIGAPTGLRFFRLSLRAKPELEVVAERALFDADRVLTAVASLVGRRPVLKWRTRLAIPSGQKLSSVRS